MHGKHHIWTVDSALKDYFWIPNTATLKKCITFLYRSRQALDFVNLVQNFQKFRTLKAGKIPRKLSYFNLASKVNQRFSFVKVFK